MHERIGVGLGELFVSDNPNHILTAHGLGSCVGVAVFDKIKKVGGLLHVMLPIAGPDVQNSTRAKFADTGTILLLDKIEAIGGRRRFLEVKIAGGAKMFNVNSQSSIFDIGERNIAQVKEEFKKQRLRIVAEDTGLNYGRTMQLHLDVGKVTIRTFGKGEKEL
jgi:chemotaxis protein CheD